MVRYFFNYDDETPIPSDQKQIIYYNILHFSGFVIALVRIRTAATYFESRFEHFVAVKRKVHTFFP